MLSIQKTSETLQSDNLPTLSLVKLNVEKLYHEKLFTRAFHGKFSQHEVLPKKMQVGLCESKNVSLVF